MTADEAFGPDDPPSADEVFGADGPSFAPKADEVFGADEPAEGFGIMRDFVLPLAASVVGGGPGAAAGALVGGLTGPLAPIAVPVLAGVGGGLTGGAAFRGAQEYLTDKEYEKVLEPSNMLWDAGFGAATGAAGKVVGSILKRGTKAIPAAGALVSSTPREMSQGIKQRLVDAADELRGDTTISGALKQRALVSDLWRGGLIDDPQYDTWMSKLDDTLDAARPDLPDVYYGRKGPLGSIQHYFSAPHRQMQRWGDEALLSGDPAMQAQGRYVRALGDAMEHQGMYARRFRALYDAQAGQIRQKLSKSGREGFKQMAEGRLVGPLSQRDQEAVALWRELQDDIADLTEMEGLLTKGKSGTLLPFRRRPDYVPEFREAVAGGVRRGGGSKGLTEHARLPVDIDDPSVVQSFDEIVRRQRLRDSERLASASLFGGLTPASDRFAKSVGGDSAMPGLAAEGLALLRERGQDQAADLLATFLKATHKVERLPEDTLLERLKSMGASAMLNRNWLTQTSEIGKAASYSGGMGDVLRGRQILHARFPGMMSQIGSTASDVGEALGQQHGRAYDPRTWAFATDRMTRRFGTYGAAGMVQRVSKQAADAVKKGGKLRGSLLREASEIVRHVEKPEDAVRYLARRFSANGQVPEDVMRDGVDSLVGRWFYNFDPGTTPNILQHPMGQLGIAYRFYLARAGRHFRDDVLGPLLRPRDSSDFLLGFRRLSYATGGTFGAATLQRAIRTMLDQGWDKMEPEELVRMAVKDTAGGVAGIPGDLASALVAEALHTAGRAGVIDTDEQPWRSLGAERGGMKDVERQADVFPILDIAKRTAYDLRSGDPERTAKGLLTTGQAIGGMSDDPRLAWLRALGHVPRSWFEEKR